MLRYVLIAVLGYLLGSISSSVLISNAFFHADVRSAGSGNAGATNMARVFGMKSGILVFLCDGLKTAAAVTAGMMLGGEVGLAVAGAACNIGHCYPVFFRFRGGKGVSVGAVLVFVIDWRVGLCLLAVFVLLFLWKHIVSLCSVTAGALLPVCSLLFGLSLPRCILAVITGLLILFQHRSNIRRLLRGEESRFSPKKKA